MQLTTAQLQTLKSLIVGSYNSVFDQNTVNALNANASPDYYIFRERINLTLVMANGYDWTIVDNESAGQARIWDRMLSLNDTLIGLGLGGIDPWKTTILKGVGECYKGNTPNGTEAHRRNILRNHFPRVCRVWEKSFVTAAPDWTVGSNNDKTGNRGAITNPDVMPLDANGEYLAGQITLSIVEASANV